MVNRNVRVRTPRRRKAWITYSNSLNDVSPAGPGVVADLLSSGLSDLGVTLAGGVTFMRMVGNMYLAQNGDSAATEFRTRRLGLTWLPGRVAGASTGDAQLPQPLEAGLREATWIQQWELGAIAQTTGNYVAGSPMEPIEMSYRTGIDVTQMRKQPQLDSKLCLVYDGVGFDTDSVDLAVSVAILIALP